ncbi:MULTISPECIES: ABC transporter ATP-binding protein [unclassified Achromobacter]|uniref:dipeptide ABC transporter ATP-binding protein n=1 Tax=unclassified Achromobacter TaxID=2626865 RepID=UPI000B515D32|nr:MULTISPECIES: ABC transporter ATP-binding protein [unclassified Achromobacter]OWT73713.1 ABC transporter ATP-binding protein [Achromobacter sp. HZ34]OWT79371.1 ABC transporter ATP-binding protein [Achromobacter sp. HZ28]
MLKIENLTVHYRGNEHPAVNHASVSVASGEIVAIIGESGSGKSTLSKAVIGLLPKTASIAGGSIRVDGQELTALSEREWVKRRGRLIGLVPQDPATSLNPVHTIGAQVTEIFRLHEAGRPRDRRQLREEAAALLELVGIDHPAQRLSQYPHELSGGMRQRVLIAMAFGLRPKLLIADEPTSALDVTVQKQVLEVFDRLARQTGVAVLFVTHNLAVACDHAQRAIVMRNGEVVESGPVEDLVFRPTQPYTRDLAASAFKVRAINDRGGRPEADAATRAIEVAGLSKVFAHGSGQRFKAVDGVSFAVPTGSTFALVGESGSGKSTVARLILGLAQASAGTVRVDGHDATNLAGDAQREVWRHVQLVQQNPQVALDPRLSVEQIIAEPLHAFGIGERAQRFQRVAELLDQVGLPRSVAQRRPRALSGGQQQRVAIARALAPRPRIVVLDEALSALDVVTQARIIDLLDRLQRELNLTYLFISHDLEVVRSLSDFVAVLRQGRLVESGPTALVFEHPRNAYTRALLDATPGQRLREPGRGMRAVALEAH